MPISGSRGGKAPAEAYDELRAKAVALMEEHNVKHPENRMTLDIAFCALALKPENHELYQQFRKDQGWPEREPEDDGD